MLDEPEIYNCNTYKEAENLILSKKADYPKNFFSGRIIELPLNLKIQEGQYLAILVVDKDVEVSYHSEVPTFNMSTLSDGSVEFYGYPLNELLDVGQLVETLDEENDCVQLGVILTHPISLEANWERYKRRGTIFKGDRFYKILIGENKVRYFNREYISNPSFPPSNDIMEIYRNWYESYQNGPNSAGRILKDILDVL